MKKPLSLLPLCLLTTFAAPAGASAKAPEFIPTCGKTTLSSATCLDLSESGFAYYADALSIELNEGQLSFSSPDLELVLSETTLSVDAASPKEALIAVGSDGDWALGMTLREMAEKWFTGQPPRSLGIASSDGYLAIEVWEHPIGALSIFDERSSLGVQGEAPHQPKLSESIVVDPDSPSLLDRGEAGDNILDRGEAGENLYPKVRIVIDTRAARTGRDPQAGPWGGISIDIGGKRVVDNAAFDVPVVDGLLPFVTDSIDLRPDLDIGRLTLAGEGTFVIANEGNISHLDAIEGANVLLSGQGSVGTGNGATPIKTGK